MDDPWRDEEFEIPSRYNTTVTGNWLRLLRLPNLLTVPGDPIVGFMALAPMAAWSSLHVWTAISAALCFYAGGIVFNDVVDVRRDLHRQPWRPLPYGLIPLVTAEGAVMVLLAIGLGLSFLNGIDSLVIGGCLLLSICAYNLELKHIPVLGPMALGFCRALAVLLGAFAAPGNPPLNLAAGCAAAACGLYVTGFSLFARYERRPVLPAWAAAAPMAGSGAALLASAPLWLGLPSAQLGAVLVLLAALLGGALLVLLRCRRDRAEETSEEHDPVSSVGLLLRGLLFLQAALVLTTGVGALQIAIIVFLLAAWPLHARLEETFYAS